MSHTKKLWKRMIKHRLRHKTKISENQFGFIPSWSMVGIISYFKNENIEKPVEMIWSKLLCTKTQLVHGSETRAHICMLQTKLC